MINGRAKGRAAVTADQMGESFHVRADERIGQEHVGPTRRCDHLGLGDRRALVFADAR